MFSAFFYLLRARGLDVSLNEWLTLMEALEKGLAQSSLTSFYYLARAILVKSESEFDKFDGAFLEYFKDVEFYDEIPQELLDWLNNPKENPNNYDFGQDMLNRSLSAEQIQKMLLERLQEQDSEHNGGKYWVGTGGMSVFGNNGNATNGIRVGGVSRKQSALHVAGERQFRDFRNDTVLDTRQFQMAFRRLRQFSSRVDAPKTELDIDGSINETCDNAGNLKLVYQLIERQGFSKYVYAAIGRPKGGQNTSTFKSMVRLLKKIDCGLITVAMDSPVHTVDVILEPSGEKKITSYKRKKSVGTEFDGRTGSLNTGGVNKKEIIKRIAKDRNVSKNVIYQKFI